MSTFIKGEAVILDFWNPDAAPAAYEPVGCLMDNSISINREVIEAQTKCDPGVIIRDAGSTSSEITFEAKYIKTESGKTDFDALLDFINVASGTTQTWRLSSDQTSPTYYYGTAVLTNLELTAPAGSEHATFSGTLQNSGLITTTDPNA